MESRVASILDRMNAENRKLQIIKKEYVECRKAREDSKTNFLKIRAYNKEENTLHSMTPWFEIEGELIDVVLELLEKHYCTQGKECNKNLDAMIEELKQK